MCDEERRGTVRLGFICVMRRGEERDGQVGVYMCDEEGRGTVRLGFICVLKRGEGRSGWGLPWYCTANCWLSRS